MDRKQEFVDFKVTTITSQVFEEPGGRCQGSYEHFAPGRKTAAKRPGKTEEAGKKKLVKRDKLRSVWVENRQEKTAAQNQEKLRLQQQREK